MSSEHPHHHHAHPIAAGGSLALLAALTFGITTPLVRRFGADAGPFTTAAALYLGAAAVSVGWTRGAPPLSRANQGRLLAVAALGAVVAPACLAWGLQRTSATTASLLLNLEAAFTVLLARMFFAEPVGRRVVTAVALMVAAGGLLIAGPAGDLGAAGWGAVGVIVASLAWAADNTLTRPLSDLEPTRVVRWKGGIGAVLSCALALVSREALPPWKDLLWLAVSGGVGYGLSLRLYLLAQRRIGAARTASIFAVAPFVGAIAAWVGGERAMVGWPALVAGVLFALATYLHLTERHLHEHAHEAIEHEHPHTHGDDHHDHVHEVPPTGEHSHPHRHEARIHAHPHALDVHHRHRH